MEVKTEAGGDARREDLERLAEKFLDRRRRGRLPGRYLAQKTSQIEPIGP